jgi:hypothetical protein
MSQAAHFIPSKPANLRLIAGFSECSLGCKRSLAPEWRLTTRGWGEKYWSARVDTIGAFFYRIEVSSSKCELTEYKPHILVRFVKIMVREEPRPITTYVVLAAARALGMGMSLSRLLAQAADAFEAIHEVGKFPHISRAIAL